MRRCILLSFFWTGLVAAGTAAVGCRKGPAPAATPKAPTIPVSHPVRRTITDFVEYTGRTDAVESVGVRARVTGYLVQMPFREGAEVKKGDLLFEVDPRPYRAQLQQAESQVALAKAQLRLAQTTYERYKPLNAKGAVSGQELDQYQASVDQAAAQVEAAKANLEVYKLNLEFTRVTSPIGGQVSRFYYTQGNLISQDQTLLTTVVSVDPMYAYFDMDERTVLRIRQAINEGKIKARRNRTDAPLDAGGAVAGVAGPEGYNNRVEIPVQMALEGEDGFPHAGVLNFVNNVVNPSTGTIAVRGLFANPLPPNGRRLLSPGMFVRIRLPIGEPHESLLVVDRALGSDQGLKYAYVVDGEKKIQYRRVKPGPLQDDGLRVIEDGLKPDDRVVVGGLQQLRPKMEVDPEDVAMPTPGAAVPPPTSGDEPQSSTPKPAAQQPAGVLGPQPAAGQKQQPAGGPNQ